MAEAIPFLKEQTGKERNTVRLKDIESAWTKQIISCPRLRQMVGNEDIPLCREGEVNRDEMG
jgi:hypothetical protein